MPGIINWKHMPYAPDRREFDMGPDERHGTLERNKALIRRFIDRLVNERDPSAAVEQFLAPDFVDHNAPPEQPPGPEGVKRVSERVLSALADLRVEMDIMIAEADKVAVRHRAQARHVGNFMGVPATGKILTWTTISIYRIENGRIAERWGLIDHADLLRQLSDLDAKRSV